MLHVEKKQKFDMLVENVARCDLCKRMQGRSKVLSEKNGDLNARVVFVGEAPGRLGADRTHVPFHGDQTGRNFERLLNISGVDREEIFITNAILCNPRDKRGNNAAPTWNEIRNCSLHLSLVLDIVQPEVVAPLGQWALNALSVIEPHSIELRRHVRRPVKWSKYTVLAFYHPGPRALVHRGFHNQIGDFYVLREIIGPRRLTQRERARRQLPLCDAPEPSLLQKVIFRIIQKTGSVSKFKLTKLLYLLDWQEIKDAGNVLTGCYYIFQKEGPLATGLSRALDEMENHEVSLQFRGRMPIYFPGDDIRYDMELPEEVARKVNLVLERYGELTNAQIKTQAYLTEPMRNILRRQRHGETMLNHPLFEGWIRPASKQ
jgi:uracil-DNA glycosylase family 4